MKIKAQALAFFEKYFEQWEPGLTRMENGYRYGWPISGWFIKMANQDRARK